MSKYEKSSEEAHHGQIKFNLEPGGGREIQQHSHRGLLGQNDDSIINEMFEQNLKCLEQQQSDKDSLEQETPKAKPLKTIAEEIDDLIKNDFA